MAKHFLSKSARELARASVPQIVERRRLGERTGGVTIQTKFLARLERAPDVETHGPGSALAVAADAVAAAVLKAEAAQSEHDDASVSEAALVKARLLLVEAGLLLEAAAFVNYHRATIEHVRASVDVDDVTP